MQRIWITNIAYNLHKAMYQPLFNTRCYNIKNLSTKKSSDSNGMIIKPTSISPASVTSSTYQKTYSFRITHPQSKGLIYVILGKKTNGMESYLFIEKLYIIVKQGKKI